MSVPMYVYLKIESIAELCYNTYVHNSMFAVS